MPQFTINGREIGPNSQPYIIAELSGNHNGQLERALALVDAAADAGADAIKLQTYTADTMTIDCDLPDFHIQGGLWDGHTLYDLYTLAHTPWEWHQPLFERAKSRGLTIFSTPFDESAVDFLEELGTPAYKIASFEITDLPLLRYIAQQGKPVIISSGMSTEIEIAKALTILRENGCSQILLLHCVSGYPTPLADINLKRITRLAETFSVPIGLSDHTLGNTAAQLAIALGAVAIEKHLTLARADGGPDAEFSLEPHELKELCSQAKLCWQALGSGKSGDNQAEQANLRFRRSLYFVADIPAGTTIKPEHIRRIRPGYGLPPDALPIVIGKITRIDIRRGKAVRLNDFISK
ncbi:pseudaminic acid synthase [Aeromonas hydrophila]|uniref:pseudaminic acid synthase n=1 Tax=Aeromonas hydrophila TaxID=644 RepID=UPI0004930010|nr:pseudaminic acid synthase [Aeromonas hydrophila]MBM0513184.1 pseudaminic acid synthase [Aeromonas hydrophila]MBW3774678.1 pseudaminic acid synthase [Aeromonas hydrophila]QWL73478.1 pseudaminic acid synthase [Aeromonas hydrophila]HAT1546385.1 pseudaminic acid synthase [Aeromonas hydrophila]HAT1557264.1 pseudaminic acid synthase [Aeromonas hydrophila]